MPVRLRSIALLVCSALIAFFSWPALATEVKVIANSGIRADSVAAADVKRIFLLEKTSLDGTSVTPVLRSNGRAHEAFVKEFLDTNDAALRTYYGTLVFTGRGSMPREFGSDAEVVSYVAKTRGAIGYVSVEASTEGVKVLAVNRGEDSGQRKLLTRVEPEYPETLKRLNIGGTVRLRITISPKGTVENVDLLGGNPILGEAAIAAVKQWVYAAAHGRTVTETAIAFNPR